MPSLEELLKKKPLTDEIKFIRKPLSITTEDRPYSFAEIDQSNLIEVTNKLNTNSTQDIQQPLAIGDYSVSNELANRHNKPNTNQTQTKHNPNTKPTQTKHAIIIEPINSTQSRHKPNTILNTQKTQTKHKPDTKPTQTRHISIIIGVQRKILLFIFEECKKARSRITEPLSIAHIANAIEIPMGSIKTSVARLCDKQFIKINGFKNGRGGWSSYEIPDDVYKELLQMETQHKLHTNLTQTIHKLDTKPNTQPNTTVPSSSSVLHNKETTTELADEWNFDITSYSKIGFTAAHIKQLASLGTISAIEVEQSLVEFSHDLDNNALPQIKTNKLNFLIGLLRAGQSYVSEGYRNEQEAIISEMARRAEDRRKKLLDEKFLSWEAALSDEERKDLGRKIPTGLRALYLAHSISNPDIKNWLFNYFIQNIKGQ